MPAAAAADLGLLLLLVLVDEPLERPPVASLEDGDT
jgi:hypothetical protein